MIHARLGGIFYLLTFLTSIPAVAFLTPILKNPGFIGGEGSAVSVQIGALLDTLNAIFCVATAVALYPIVKHFSQVRALGFFASRIFEAFVIMIGVLSLLAVVSLRSEASTSDPQTLNLIGQALLQVRNWSFLLGPGLFPAFNALLLASVLFQARLVPRILPTLGLVGAPLLLISVSLAYFGVIGQSSAVAAVLILPIALWELGLGLWLSIKGIKNFTPIN